LKKYTAQTYCYLFWGNIYRNVSKITEYYKVRDIDNYLYRAVNKFGNSVDFILTKRSLKVKAQKKLI